jgi:hypothetical protein
VLINYTKAHIYVLLQCMEAAASAREKPDRLMLIAPREASAPTKVYVALVDIGLPPGRRTLVKGEPGDGYVEAFKSLQTTVELALGRIDDIAEAEKPDENSEEREDGKEPEDLWEEASGNEPNERGEW